MNAEERAQILSQWVGVGGIGVEVGVWKGDFSQAILDWCIPERLHLIDPWEFQPELPNAWYGGAAANSAEHMDAIAASVLSRFERDINSGRIQVHRDLSTNVSLAEGVSWIYIDADHRQAAVRRDLLHWMPQLRQGGVVVLDDFGLEGWWENGVTKAVRELEDRGLVKVESVAGTQALLRRTAASDAPHRQGRGGIGVESA